MSAPESLTRWLHKRQRYRRYSEETPAVSSLPPAAPVHTPPPDAPLDKHLVKGPPKLVVSQLVKPDPP